MTLRLRLQLQLQIRLQLPLSLLKSSAHLLPRSIRQRRRRTPPLRRAQSLRRTPSLRSNPNTRSSMTASKRLSCGALLLGLLSGSALAHAQPSAAQKETARGLMAEARELRDRGDLAGALKRFSAADSIMGVPTTGFEVAATQAQLGQLVEARETLRHVLAIAPGADDPEPFNEARSKARALDQQLLARLGALRFDVSGVSR